MDWQPIETAPKDGTIFLGCEAPSLGEVVRMPCKWEGGRWRLAWGCWPDETDDFEPVLWVALNEPPNT